MKDWKQVVGAVAPALATALGSPLAGAAVAALSHALLGKPDGTEDEVAAAVAAGGVDALQKLREADNAFAVRMRELGVDVYRLDQADRASARGREAATGDSWTPRLIAAALLLTFGWIVYTVLAGRIEALKDPVVAGVVGSLIGYVAANVNQVVSYYFGSSSGSAQKTEILANRPPKDAPPSF